MTHYNNRSVTDSLPDRSPISTDPSVHRSHGRTDGLTKNYSPPESVSPNASRTEEHNEFAAMDAHLAALEDASGIADVIPRAAAPSTHEPATMDESTIEAEVVEEPWDEWLYAALQPRLDASDAAWVVSVIDRSGIRNTTETTDQSRPVVGLVARVLDAGEPVLSDLDTVAHARTQAVAAARHALLALRELLGVDPAVMSHGTQVRAGCVVDDLGQMGDRIRAFLLDDAPALVAEVRQLRDQLAEVEAARTADTATIGVLAAAVAKVAALHVDDGDGWCKACQTLGYPCPTVLALGAGR